MALSPKSKRTRAEIFIHEIENSNLYKCYKKEALKDVKDYDIYDLLHIAVDTPKENAQRNYKKLKEYAIDMAREDILDFLKWVKKEYKTVL